MLNNFGLLTKPVIGIAVHWLEFLGTSALLQKQSMFFPQLPNEYSIYLISKWLPISPRDTLIES